MLCLFSKYSLFFLGDADYCADILTDGFATTRFVCLFSDTGNG